MEAIVNNLIKAIGWSILHSLWQGAIIYAILFTILMVWPKMSARLKHNLAFGSLFLIFSSFCFTFFSIFELPTANSIKNIAFNQLAYQDISQFASSFNLKTEAYFPVVVTVYIIGIAFQMVVLSSGYIKLKKLKKSNTIAIPTSWKVIFEMTLFQLKINKKVQFYLSEKVNVPLVIGFFKPVVLFPFSLATQLDAKQVEAILIHELSHIRRNDYLINLVKTFIETLLFFNPFVWLTTKFIHIEREHACDDLVINATGTPLTYAHALLKLELLKDKQSPALSLAATGKNQHLYQRIKRITDMKTNYINVKQQFFILTLAIATVASLAWINPSKKQEVKTKGITSLKLIKPSIIEDKALNKNLTLKADTDTTKVKHKAKIIITDDKGNVKTYTSVKEMPDSLRKKVERQIYLGDSISAYYNSQVFKAKIAEVQKNALMLSKKYESKEWKDQMAKVQENALAIAKKYDSKEWKDNMAKVQENALAIAKKYESKEWKDQMAKVQENALAIAKKYDSKEWKDNMAKVQENALAIAKKYNSKEWKDNMAKVQKNAEEIQKKYNSPEWKQKMEDLKKLQESPEYKELRKKYESDLEELKKKKGIKTDKALLLFNGDNVDKVFLPFTGDLKTAFAATLPLNFKSADLGFETLNLNFETLTPINLKLATPLTTPLKVKVN
ncbi:peptidase M56 [Pedobacter polaris]|uniref:Peptidase M56 n=1 Tax=Pedobacter polaris TaxID=2571273 RepID=A0A4U1CKY9_9SPHI|nr:M56 family metallopeptidase [Pedobacter polaris]TKC05724.1 peptidase M56 [Pedobacter polaris]